MTNIRYAFASVSYHKKLSVAIGVCTTFFLFLLTSFLNLADIEKSLYTQVSSLANASTYTQDYQKIMSFYSLLYMLLLSFWIILIGILSVISLRSKKQDMIKWRLKGFSHFFIIKQAILESLIPVFIGIIVSTLFFLVCQHTYEFILFKTRLLFSTSLKVQPLSFFSSNTMLESLPTHLAATENEVSFFSIKISSLTNSTIFNAFFKNCLVFIAITSGFTTVLVYFISKYPKKYLGRE